MNISERARLYREIRRVLKSGAGLRPSTSCWAAATRIIPFPWARTPATSFLLDGRRDARGDRTGRLPQAGMARRFRGGQGLVRPVARIGAAAPCRNLGIVMGPDWCSWPPTWDAISWKAGWVSSAPCSRPHPRTPGSTRGTAHDCRRSPADIVPARRAWGNLLWLVPITVLWTLLIFWQPTIPESGVPTTAARLMTYALIAVGLSG